MKLKTLIIIVFFLLLYIASRSNLNFPVTGKEAKEAYSAYTILFTGKDPDNKIPFIFPSAGSEYLSPLSVYGKVLTIELFGLRSLGVRIGSVFIGFLAVLVFYLLSLDYFQENKKVIIASVLFILSPFFLRYSIFDFGLTSALFFCLLAVYFNLKNKTYIVLFASLLAVISALEALPFVITVIIFKDLRKRGNKKVFLKSAFLILILFLFFKLNPAALGYLQNSSFIKNIKPSNYTYLIDKRLSFGKILNSPLVTNGFNYNRIAHNKLFYFVNEIFKLPVYLFNFELLSSSLQSSTILVKDKVNSLLPPSIFVWEWFLILPGVVLQIKRKNESFSLLFASGMASLLFFPGNQPLLLLPSILIAEVSFFFMIIKNFRFKTLFVGSSLILYLLSYFSFLDIFFIHSNLWMNKNDLVQHQIWNFVGKDLVAKNKIIETDRLGEPAFYYLYYHKIDPELFFSNSHLVKYVDSDLKRIESAGNVRFTSFEYYKEDRPNNYLWIGLPGEFVGKNEDYENINHIDGGAVINKIYDVTIENSGVGDDLLFVKT